MLPIIDVLRDFNLNILVVVRLNVNKPDCKYGYVLDSRSSVFTSRVVRSGCRTLYVALLYPFYGCFTSFIIG